MESISDRILGLEYDEAESLLQNEGVNFVVKYTEPDRKKEMFDTGEHKDRVVRVRKIDDTYELTVCEV